MSNPSSSDYQFPKHVLSRAADDDVKTLNDPFRSPPRDTIISVQNSVPMASISGFLVSPFEYKLSDEEEVFHMRVPQEEVEEEEAMPIPVQETPLTTCPPPSTAASIANLEYPEEPLPTAASVASEECLEPLPMAVTESSHECPDVPRTDDSNISPEQTSERFEHTDVDDMENLSSSKIRGCHLISVFSSWRPRISCFCETQSCFETLAHSELVHEDENKDLIISKSTDLPPVNRTPTQFIGKTYGFLVGPETTQDPSQHQQNWGLWTYKITELFCYTSTMKDGVHKYSRKLCYTLVHWSAHLFQTALHQSGALFVLRPEL